MVTLYVLKGHSGKRYVGITNNLSRRLSEHRSKSSKGGQIIGEFKLIHTEVYSDYKKARIREKFLKSGIGRRYLNELESRTRPARGG
ncbi:MAG: GIY-YIG nuclease family protein [candidate division Zixibacteria bacterium]|nr:GIY-YIG nuclease family protein [candidate division Zixibacteria bacterium]